MRLRTGLREAGRRGGLFARRVAANARPRPQSSTLHGRSPTDLTEIRRPTALHLSATRRFVINLLEIG